MLTASIQKFAIAFAAASITLLAGCAATVSSQSASSGAASALAAPTNKTTKVTLVITGSAKALESKDWQTFRAEWRTAFEAAAKEAGVGFAFAEDAPTNGAAGETLVKITVSDYRYLTPGARFGFGIMTGNAFIESKADFIELATQKNLGSKPYSTSSSAWQGVFSAMTDKQVAAISKEILQSLSR
jgi:uncharacterized lipoprotein YajG